MEFAALLVISAAVVIVGLVSDYLEHRKESR